MKKEIKKEINDLLIKMQLGEICIGETVNHLLELLNISNIDTELESIKQILLHEIHSEITNSLVINLVHLTDACRFKSDIVISFKSKLLLESFIKNCDINFIHKNKAKVGGYFIEFAADIKQRDNITITI